MPKLNRETLKGTLAHIETLKENIEKSSKETLNAAITLALKKLQHLKVTCSPLIQKNPLYEEAISSLNSYINEQKQTLHKPLSSSVQLKKQLSEIKEKKSLKRGDIFIVKDNGPKGGQIPSFSFMFNFISSVMMNTKIEGTAPVLHWLQFITGNVNPEYTHAGLIISEQELIELSGMGIQLAKIHEELNSKNFTVFRCNDSDVAQLASDLAENMEQSEVLRKYPHLKANQIKIAYEYIGGFFALFFAKRTSQKLTEDKINEVSQSMDLPDKLFCSQFVIFTYALASKLLSKPNQINIPQNSLPGTLYEYLNQNPAFTQVEYSVEHIENSFISSASL